uniref:Uncharacterized protein n=1 Tax=Oryza punctata TaxID=4537 RepID=A0A0E0LP29_ORYPU
MNSAVAAATAAGGSGGKLFIMDRIAKPESYQFEIEALIHRNFSPVIPSKSWDCEILSSPPPDVDRVRTCLEITSYGVVRGDSQICVSVDSVGTYCMDTASYAWSEVGKWTLPFQGKVEYVPELKLWFGFSAKDLHFAAADLTAMEYSGEAAQPPKLLYSWKEFEPHQEWEQTQDPQLVNLGSGKFCISRFFHTNGDLGDESSGGKNVTVLTGVEFTNVGNGIVCIGLVKHKSKCHKARCGNDGITAVLYAERVYYEMFDAETRRVEEIHCHRNRRHMYSPPYIFIPAADGGNGGGSIYFMETHPSDEQRWQLQRQQQQQQPMLSYQFMAFVHDEGLTWRCHLLPPPPFLLDPKFKRPDGHGRHSISSYAVIVDDDGGDGGGGGGSHIIMSVDDVSTHCLDTARHTWTQVGEWTLPFVGKVEYVPELKLWFGICNNHGWYGWCLGAIDLSNVLSSATAAPPPQLVGVWKELDVAEKWSAMKPPRLGAGRFCVARFLLPFHGDTLILTMDEEYFYRLDWCRCRAVCCRPWRQWRRWGSGAPNDQA